MPSRGAPKRRRLRDKQGAAAGRPLFAAAASIPESRVWQTPFAEVMGAIGSDANGVCRNALPDRGKSAAGERAEDRACWLATRDQSAVRVASSRTKAGSSDFRTVGDQAGQRALTSGKWWASCAAIIDSVPACLRPTARGRYRDLQSASSS